MDAAAEEIARAVVRRLEDGWNAGDGDAFGEPFASHAERDSQALLSADWIARRLDRDPTLPRRARSWLVHRLHTASEREVEELNKWIRLRLLDTASVPRLQYVLGR